MKHILITGQPGVGKTTLTKKLIKHLADSHATFDGFVTEEVRSERSERIGFNVPPNKDRTCSATCRKNGKGILVIDEIGKMELFSGKFECAISEAFKKEGVRILATVPLKGPPLVERLKKDPTCHLITVTPQNRNQLLEEITTLLNITDE